MNELYTYLYDLPGESKMHFILIFSLKMSWRPTKQKDDNYSEQEEPTPAK